MTIVNQNLVVLVVLISAVLTVVSCTGQSAGKSPIPNSGPTISEIYRQHMGNIDRSHSIRRLLPQGSTSLHGYTRQAFNELNTLFPRLPNPTIIIYVFPHLSAERTPIPGYSTMFQMYERVEYALPGETSE